MQTECYRTRLYIGQGSECECDYEVEAEYSVHGDHDIEVEAAWYWDPYDEVGWHLLEDRTALEELRDEIEEKVRMDSMFAEYTKAGGI